MFISNTVTEVLKIADAIKKSNKPLLQLASVLDPLYGKKNCRLGSMPFYHWKVTTPIGTLTLVNKEYATDPITTVNDIAIG